MRIFGNTRAVGVPVERASDTKWVSRFLVSVDCYLVKLTVWLDGLGSGVGSQVLKGVVYNAAGSLVAVSREVVVADGQAAGWVDFVFATPVSLSAGDYDLGTIAGGASNTARVFVVDPDGAGGRWNADSYVDGPTSVFGASTGLTGRAAAFGTWTQQWNIPAEDDFYFGRLPFPESQFVFAQGGPLKAPVYHVRCGWHGDDLDEETGAFAIVREGGPLEILLGERLRITRSDRFNAGRVHVFCHNRFPIVDDISVPRRMFLALGYPAADNFQTTVEIMAA